MRLLHPVKHRTKFRRLARTHAQKEITNQKSVKTRHESVVKALQFHYLKMLIFAEGLTIFLLFCSKRTIHQRKFGKSDFGIHFS